MTPRRHLVRAAPAALAAFAAVVAVASAGHPGAAHRPGPAGAVLVSSGPAAGDATEAGGAPVVARHRVTGAFEAQALVLRLAAEAYPVVAGEGPAALAAVAQARAAEAFPATRFVAVSPRP